MPRPVLVTTFTMTVAILLGLISAGCEPEVAAEALPVDLNPDTLITDWRVAGPVQADGDARILEQDLLQAENINLGGNSYPVRTLAVNTKRQVGVGIIPEIPMWPEEADMFSLPADPGVYYAGTSFRAERGEPISLIIMTTGSFMIWLNGQPLGISIDSREDLANPKRLDGLPVDQPYDQWMVWNPLGLDGPQYAEMDWWFAASVAPYLIDNLLITQIGNFIRALNKEAGKTVWEQRIKYPSPSMSATVFGQSRPMQLGETTVLISPDGRVYRLSDGKVLMDPDGWTLITGRTDKMFNGKPDNRSVWNAVSAGTPAFRDDVAYFAFPNGIRALRYALDGPDRVTAEPVWIYELSDERVTVRKKGGREQEALRSFSHEPAVFVDASPLYDPQTDRIWFGPHKSGEIEIIDATTGKAIHEGTTPYWLPEGKGCAIAGDLVFAQTGHGVTHVYARQGSLTPVAENAVILPIVRDVRARTMTWNEYRQKWFDRGFEKIIGSDRTTGELFFHGDAIYMRTDTALVCIGEDNDN